MGAVKMDKSSINFWNKTECDRCDKSLKDKGRMMSWFTEECLCMECIESESWIKRQLHNTLAYEGCGYIPEVWKDEKLCHSSTGVRREEECASIDKKSYGGKRNK